MTLALRYTRKRRSTFSSADVVILVASIITCANIVLALNQGQPKQHHELMRRSRIDRYLNKLTDQTIAGLHHQGLTNEKELKRSSINLFLQAFIAITSYILAGALWLQGAYWGNSGYISTGRFVEIFGRFGEDAAFGGLVYTATLEGGGAEIADTSCLADVGDTFREARSIQHQITGNATENNYQRSILAGQATILEIDRLRKKFESQYNCVLDLGGFPAETEIMQDYMKILQKISTTRINLNSNGISTSLKSHSNPYAKLNSVLL